MTQSARRDWFIQEWFATVGLKQADLVSQLGYHKNTAFKLWHGIQDYRRDNIDDVAALLNIQPFELLMHPDDAMSYRRLRSVLAEVAKGEPASQQTPPAVARLAKRA